MGWSSAQELGLTLHRPQDSYKGYTLIAPLGGDSVFLIDIDGRFVHRWRFDDFEPQSTMLLDNGNLFVLGLEQGLRPDDRPPEVGALPEPFERIVRRLGGNASAVREVSWDGTTVWEHGDRTMHHDCVRLANGNTVYLAWSEMTEELTKAVRGGHRQPREKLGPMLGDDVVEIDSEGNEVRRVATWTLYDPRRDPICPLEARIEWTHANSVDVNDAGEILMSCRNTSRVSVIDADGAMTWNYGADISHQHHATWVPGGNVQIFDNGMHRMRGSTASKVIEVDPATDEIVWSYEGSPGAQFFSGHISGATRLPNHNTLVCEGTSGRLFEVTRRGEVIWEWWNPVYVPRPDGTSMGWLYRAHRYSPDHPALAGRHLDPAEHASLNQLYGLA